MHREMKADLLSSWIHEREFQSSSWDSLGFSSKFISWPEIRSLFVSECRENHLAPCPFFFESMIVGSFPRFARNGLTYWVRSQRWSSSHLASLLPSNPCVLLPDGENQSIEFSLEIFEDFCANFIRLFERSSRFFIVDEQTMDNCSTIDINHAWSTESSVRQRKRKMLQKERTASIVTAKTNHRYFFRHSEIIEHRHSMWQTDEWIASFVPSKKIHWIFVWSIREKITNLLPTFF